MGINSLSVLCGLFSWTLEVAELKFNSFHVIQERSFKREHIWSDTSNTTRTCDFYRLLANAILDPVYGATNSWFVMACETAMPIRSFNFTYNYLMESQHSFVESFAPRNEPIQWFDMVIDKSMSRDQLRKGEMWWALELRHAFMIIEDWTIYYTYKRLCHFWCAPDEQYVPTLLGTYVLWSTIC